MKIIEIIAIVLTALFVLGVLGCAVSLPSVVYQFIRVLFEKDAPAEGEKAAAD